MEDLAQGVDIFIGTTGRVLDHMNQGNIDMSYVETVILDEADVMLKMGFREDCQQIFDTIKRENKTKCFQVGLFSATFPDWVKEICAQYMS
jgi:superfamily II DNA/RNA helicase